MLDAAIEYRNAGLSPLPIAPGFKSPSIVSHLNNRGVNISWSSYKDNPASCEILESWFTRTTMGIGLVTGFQTRGARLEVLDIDDADTLKRFNEIAPQELLRRLVYEVTPGGGGHYGYLCTEYTGNQKLAQVPVGNGVKTLIETRGLGGQVVVSPTPTGVHPEHPDRAYTVVHGSWLDIPIISPEDRQILHGIARVYNEVNQPEVPQGISPWRAIGRPGDKLNAEAGHEWWEELLTEYGWTVARRLGSITYWRRPGKDEGHSATYGACGIYFYVFSPNAYPFQPNRGYAPFSAYTLLKFGGNFQRAAASLGGR